MAIAAGSKVGPYEILALLGAGDMGEVYKARDTRLDRLVAIKVLPQHLSSHADLRERFEREARAISTLNHPNICVLHDIGTQDSYDYLVLEYLEGETLAQRIDRGPLPLEQILKHSIEIADALDRAVCSASANCIKSSVQVCFGPCPAGSIRQANNPRVRMPSICGYI